MKVIIKYIILIKNILIKNINNLNKVLIIIS